MNTTDILIFALAVVCASIPAAAGMQWLIIREVADERARRSSEKTKSGRHAKTTTLEMT